MRFLAWLTVRRAQRSWRLMLASAFGVLLAATLMSGAVSHSSTLAIAGLKYTLDPTATGNNLDLQVSVFSRPMGRADYERLDELVTEKTAEHVGWLDTGMRRDGQTQNLSFTYSQDQANVAPGELLLFFQDGFQEHTRLLEGRWPSDQAEASPGEVRPIEMVIAIDTLRLLGALQWEVGMDLYLVPFEAATTERIPITIVGSIEAIDRADPYWAGSSQRLEVVNLETGFVAPLYVRQSDFFDVLGAKYPTLLSTYSWYVALDTGSLTTSSAPVARQDLKDLEADVNQSFPRSLAFSPLGRTVSEYERFLALARVPLFMFTSLVVGVVLYYLVLISWMLARSRGPETALLRSRGASPFQVGALLGLGEGLLIVVPSVIVGPFIGTTIARFLPVGNVEIAGGAGDMTLFVFVAAAIVGVISIGMIVGVGLLVAGQNIVEFLRERSRPIHSPALYRYALDLLVLSALGLVWWQIRGRGGLLTQRLLGEGLETDLTLLLGPALLLLSVGLMLLRVLPYFLRLLARVAAGFNAVWLVHGFNRMARDPLPYGALAVLLMLAAALGVFGATFGPTLTGSQTDQIRYAIGGEIVVPAQPLTPNQTPKETRNVLAALEGISAVSPVHNGVLIADEATIQGGQAALLGVDPDALAKTSWFRPDIAELSLENLMALLPQRIDPDAGIPLPEGAQGIGAWARAERAYSGYSLWARFRDSDSPPNFEHFVLGGLGSPEWTYLEAPIPQRVHLRPPYFLMGFYVTGPTLAFSGRGSVAIDNAVGVVGAERRVLETFEERGNWEPIPNLVASQDTFDIGGGALAGRGAARFGWSYPIQGGAPRGIFLSPVPLPLLAIGGPPLVPGQQVSGVLAAQAIPIQVQAAANYFPSVSPSFGTFLVVDLEALDIYQRYLPLPRDTAPTHFWLGLVNGADKPKLLGELRQLYPPGTVLLDREAEANSILDNPLAGGAWHGLALMAMGTLSGVAIVGMVLYTALAFRRTRLELALLRAMGFTRRQIGLVLGLEGAVVAVVGLGLGVAVGVWMGRWSLGYLDVTVAGRQVVPPLVLSLDDQLTALAYLGVGLAAVLATILAVTMASRLRLAEVLRVEE